MMQREMSASREKKSAYAMSVQKSKIESNHFERAFKEVNQTMKMDAVRQLSSLTAKINGGRSHLASTVHSMNNNVPTIQSTLTERQIIEHGITTPYSNVGRIHRNRTAPHVKRNIATKSPLVQSRYGGANKDQFKYTANLANARGSEGNIQKGLYNSRVMSGTGKIGDFQSKVDENQYIASEIISLGSRNQSEANKWRRPGTLESTLNSKAFNSINSTNSGQNKWNTGLSSDIPRQIASNQSPQVRARQARQFSAQEPRNQKYKLTSEFQEQLKKCPRPVETMRINEDIRAIGVSSHASYGDKRRSTNTIQEKNIIEGKFIVTHQKHSAADQTQLELQTNQKSNQKTKAFTESKGQNWIVADFRRGLDALKPQQDAEKDKKRQMDLQDMNNLGQYDLKEFLLRQNVVPKICIPIQKDEDENKLKERIDKNEYYLMKAVVYLQSMQLRKAEWFLQQGMQLFPNDISFQFNTALLEYLKEDYVAGARILQVMEEEGKFPSRKALLQNQFLCLLRAGLYDEILKYEKEVGKTRMYMEDEEIVLKVIYVYSKQRKHLEASRGQQIIIQPTQTHDTAQVHDDAAIMMGSPASKTTHHPQKLSPNQTQQILDQQPLQPQEYYENQMEETSSKKSEIILDLPQPQEIDSFNNQINLSRPKYHEQNTSDVIRKNDYLHIEEIGQIAPLNQTEIQPDVNEYGTRGSPFDMDAYGQPPSGSRSQSQNNSNMVRDQQRYTQSGRKNTKLQDTGSEGSTRKLKFSCFSKKSQMKLRVTTRRQKNQHTKAPVQATQLSKIQYDQDQEQTPLEHITIGDFSSIMQRARKKQDDEVTESEIERKQLKQIEQMKNKLFQDITSQCNSKEELDKEEAKERFKHHVRNQIEAEIMKKTKKFNQILDKANKGTKNLNREERKRKLLRLLMPNTKHMDKELVEQERKFNEKNRSERTKEYKELTEDMDMLTKELMICNNIMGEGDNESTESDVKTATVSDQSSSEDEEDASKQNTISLCSQKKVGKRKGKKRKSMMGKVNRRFSKHPKISSKKISKFKSSMIYPDEIDEANESLEGEGDGKGSYDETEEEKRLEYESLDVSNLKASIRTSKHKKNTISSSINSKRGKVVKKRGIKSKHTKASKKQTLSDSEASSDWNDPYKRLDEFGKIPEDKITDDDLFCYIMAISKKKLSKHRDKEKELLFMLAEGLGDDIEKDQRQNLAELLIQEYGIHSMDAKGFSKPGVFRESEYKDRIDYLLKYQKETADARSKMIIDKIRQKELLKENKLESEIRDMLMSGIKPDQIKSAVVSDYVSYVNNKQLDKEAVDQTEGHKLNQLQVRVIRRELLKKFFKQEPNYDILDSMLFQMKFFEAFRKSTRMKIYNILEYQHVKKGKSIIAKKNTGIMYLIIKGSVCVKKQKKGKIAKSANTLFEGECFGDLNLFGFNFQSNYNSKRITTHLEATDDCDIFGFNRETLAEIMIKDIRVSMYEKIQYLMKSDCFCGISAYAVFLMANNLKTKTFACGKVVQHPNRIPNKCYIILEGHCKVISSQSLPVPQNMNKEYEEDLLKKDPMKFSLYEDPHAEKSLILATKHHTQPALCESYEEDEKCKPLWKQQLEQSFAFDGTKIIKTQKDEAHPDGKYLKSNKVFHRLLPGSIIGARTLVDQTAIDNHILDNIQHYLKQTQMTIDTSILEDSDQYKASKKKHKPIPDVNDPMSHMEDFQESDEDEEAYFKQRAAFIRSDDFQALQNELMKTQCTVVADSCECRVMEIDKEDLLYLNEELREDVKRIILHWKFKEKDRPLNSSKEIREIKEQTIQWNQYKVDLVHSMRDENKQNKMIQ